ncbi:MFS transporter [Mesobacillus sp. AQ2]|jgi:MFS transporter, NNP family, nitrate/nitrite transporter|uniref:nitrate/nitrite transporter n=1 Tax=Bacillaceae TaxID=186817 RepID=UPI0011A605A7|nr:MULTISPECIES: nitrate/nitrite transporter [Bacillaceae]MCM3124888.1 MFS transporter [Mesobacillus sp. MER 33]MCM3232803.1 MFS transporter [Mesobacillus sp. MER 48]WHX41892.1 MFS transporter [Mesobacillus sp. AQ2]
MRTQKNQLPLQTLSLVAGFMVWVILSALMPFIKEDIKLTANQIAMATAIPVVLGSVMRIPIGYWTNKYGARKLFFVSFAFLLFPVYFISLADSFIDLLIGGLLVGIGGAIFSVGVTSLPKYYPKERHGFVNGIYGVGNLGTAVTTFSAPVIASQIGWQSTVQLYLVLLLAFALLNFFLGDKNEPKVPTPLGDQIKSVYKNQKLWALSLFYFLTFGSFVAFTIYLPNFLVSHFELDKVDAGIRTAGFIALATFFRPIGGWLGDKFNSFIILMIVFAGMTISGILLSFTPSLTLYTIGCLTVAISAGIGNGTVFKLVPLYFSKQAGIVNGIVSAMGGLGGFFPPLMLAFLFNLTGHYAIGFMALSQVALASLIIVIWMYYQDKLSLAKNIIDHTAEGIMITDVKGMIEKVNQSFTNVTGYKAEEVIGRNPRVLRSGKHGEAFYKEMWKSIEENGFWQGEIWNKKKNGNIYPEWLTISPLKNEAGEIKNYVGIFSELPIKKK